MTSESAFEVVQVLNATSVAEFARIRSVPVGSIWLPLLAKAIIDSNEPFIVYNKDTKTITTRRSKSIAELQWLLPREDVIVFNPKSVPSHAVCFTQCNETLHASKRIAANSMVLIRELPSIAHAIAEGSATHSDSRKALYSVGSTKEQATAASVRSAASGRKRGLALVQRSAGDALDAGDEEDETDLFSDAYISKSIEDELRRRRETSEQDEGGESGSLQIESGLTPPLGSTEAARSARSNVISGVIAELKKARLEAPLHNACGGSSNTIRIANAIWQRNDPRVLVLHHHAGGENGVVVGSATQRGLSSILVAAFFIEGAVIKSNIFQSGPDAWTLADAQVPHVMRQLHARGYRIVLLAHYASLHHGNKLNLEAKCGRIVKLLQNHLLDVSVTVLISVVSNFAGKSGKSLSSFALPNSGLWSYFVSQYNDRCAPDDVRSMIVGCGVPFLRASGRLSVKDVDAAAADNTGVDYLAEGVSPEAVFAAGCNTPFVDIHQLIERERQ